MNAFTARKVAENYSLYKAMCQGKIAQRGIHKMRNGKAVRRIIGQATGDYLIEMPVWWNGRHWGFKILCRETCRFESDHGHH